MWRHAPASLALAALATLVLTFPGGNNARAQDTRPRSTDGATVDAAPPLPALDLDAYPPDARTQIATALAAARDQMNDAEAVGRLALVLHAWEEFGPAAVAYARAQALAPASPDWWYFGGMLAGRRGLHADAARQFRRALDNAPDNPLIAIRLADAALEAGDAEEATRLYEALATRPETAPAALYGIGRVEQMTGDTAGARQAFERAVSLYPAFGAAHYAMAQLQRRKGDTAGARESLQRQQQCLTCWPMPTDPWRARLDAIRDDAAALLRRGIAAAGSASETADADAIRLHEESLVRKPGLGQAHINLIELYGRTGNLPRAEQHYQAALALPGYEAEAHRAWGWVLLQQRQAERALQVLNAAAALMPANAQVQNGRGLALELLNRPGDAVEAYTRAVAAGPAAKDARFNLARALIHTNQLPEAIDQLEQLRQPQDAHTPRHLFALSAAYVRRGDLEAGRRMAQEALDLARRYGQTDLANTIERDLTALRAAMPQ